MLLVGFRDGLKRGKEGSTWGGGRGRRSSRNVYTRSMSITVDLVFSAVNESDIHDVGRLAELCTGEKLVVDVCTSAAQLRLVMPGSLSLLETILTFQYI